MGQESPSFLFIDPSYANENPSKMFCSDNKSLARHSIKKDIRGCQSRTRFLRILMFCPFMTCFYNAFFVHPQDQFRLFDERSESESIGLERVRFS